MGKFDYNKVGTGGRIYFYYNVGQTFESQRTGATYKIEASQLRWTVQMYLVSTNGVLAAKPMTAARVHFMLYEAQAIEIMPGNLKELPLTQEEVKEYFTLLPDERNKHCPLCGGTGLKWSADFEHRDICLRCTMTKKEKIKSFCADKRLTERLNKWQ